MLRPAPISTLFPYTTLFRSHRERQVRTVLSMLRRDEARFEDRILGDVSAGVDRKSTRLNSSHVEISYAVFCLKKKSGLMVTVCQSQFATRRTLFHVLVGSGL